MRRRLLNLVTLVSLLLCVAAVATWLRSHWVQEAFAWERNNLFTLIDQQQAPVDAPSAGSADAAADDASAAPGTFFHKRLELLTAPGAVRLQWEHSELTGFAGSPWEPGFTHETLATDEYPLYWRLDRRGAWLDWSAGSFEAVAREEGAPPPQFDLSGGWRSQWEVTLPLWLVTLSTALAPLWHVGARVRRRKERRRGFCPVCGYDLRATPDHCPECGHVSATAATTRAGSR